MSMNVYKEIREGLCEHLENYAERGKIRSEREAEFVRCLLSGIEKTYKIEMFEQGGYGDSGDSGYSEGYRRNDDNYSARRRDSRGRYMDGYSHGERQEIMEMLEKALRTSGNDRDKEKIRRCMEQIDKG